MRGTYRDDKAACSTLAVPLKRRDVEVGTVKRAQQRNKGMPENRTNVCSLNHLYQFKANVGKISFNKSWGMNTPAILSQKVLNHTKFVAWQCLFLHSGLTLSHAFSLGHGFSIIKVLPTPCKRAKEQGHGRKTYKVFSLNPLYQSQEDYWNITYV